MGVDVSVGGVPEWDVSDLTVSEDATPIDPSDSFGGVGSIEFTITEAARSKSLLNEAVTVSDALRGSTAGVVRALGGGRGQVKVAALSRLSLLNCDRTALPHVGTLESLLTYYFGLCDITTGFTVDAAIADVEVVAPGWYGNVWEKINKQLAPAYGFEVHLVDSIITARPLLREVLQGGVRPVWGLDESRLAQTVECWFYPAAEITDALVVGNEQSVVSNIDAGEVLEFTIELEASLSSVVQPVAVDSVAFSASSASEYSVYDNYGEPVSAAAWVAGGGHVSVEIGEDTRTLNVTVRGSQNRFLAPYSLEGTAISGKPYSTLRVIGTGVSLTRDKYVLPACTDPRATDEVGAEVDNDFINSWGHAHMAMLPAVRRHGVVSRRLSHDAVASPGAFGNVVGARVFDDSDVYRVRSVRMSPPSAVVAYEAEVDTTFADVDAVAEGYTIAEYDAQWLDGPISEFDLRPLTPVVGEFVPPGEGLYPGSETFPSSTTFPGA
jgi:hypothetical protein